MDLEANGIGLLNLLFADSWFLVDANRNIDRGGGNSTLGQ